MPSGWLRRRTPAGYVIATFASLFAGRWYDRAGPRVVFATGALVYVIGYGLFSAGIHSVIAVVLAFAAAGSEC